MKKLIQLSIVAGAMLFPFACKKGGGSNIPPVKSFTVTLNLRPTGAGDSIDGSKKVFLSLRSAKVYTVAEAKDNASDIDLVIYDGTTTASGLGSMYLVSPDQAAVNKIKEPGNDNSLPAKMWFNGSKNQLVSSIWYFETQLPGAKTLTSIAKVKDFSADANGTLTLEIKQLP